MTRDANNRARKDDKKIHVQLNFALQYAQFIMRIQFVKALLSMYHDREDDPDVLYAVAAAAAAAAAAASSICLATALVLSPSTRAWR